MLDCKKDIVTELSTILPTYYELFCEGVATPCITYREHSNNDTLVGDTLGYSRLGWYIKVWGSTVDDITNYALLVDSKMRSLGYNRISSNELVLDDQICKVMIYQGLGLEQF